MIDPTAVLTEARAEQRKRSSTGQPNLVDTLIDALDKTLREVQGIGSLVADLKHLIDTTDVETHEAIQAGLVADLQAAVERFEMSQAEPEPEWEYGFYDSHPDGNWQDDPAPQESPLIWWYVFGMPHKTAESAGHSGSKSVNGQAVIVRRRGEGQPWEHLPKTD